VRPQAPDLSAFSGGMAFGMPGAEDVAAGPSEPMHTEPKPAVPIPSGEEAMNAREAGVEGIEEPAPAVIEPELAFVTEPQVETPAPEPTPEATEPKLVEEEFAPPPTPEEPPGRTMMFRAPADIAQPIFSDEIETSTPVAEAEEAPAAEPPSAVETAANPERLPAAEITPAEGTPVAPRTLENYTLNEAASGQVRFAPSLAEAPQELESKPAAPLPEAAEAPRETVAPRPKAAPPPPEPTDEPRAPAGTIAPQQVFFIVHKIVVEMSPPALSPQMIEDIARKFADEISDELNSES
jgi:hypothetical protein